MPKQSKHDEGSDDAAVDKPDRKQKKEKKEKVRDRSRSSSPQRHSSDAGAPQASEGGQMLDCQDCQQKWEFTADEKAFFEEKGFSIPIRCGPCRKIRKQQKEGGGGGGGGRGGRGGFGGGGDRGSGCFNCGEDGHRLFVVFSGKSCILCVIRPADRTNAPRKAAAAAAVVVVVVVVVVEAAAASTAVRMATDLSSAPPEVEAAGDVEVEAAALAIKWLHAFQRSLSKQLGILIPNQSCLVALHPQSFGRRACSCPALLAGTRDAVSSKLFHSARRSLLTAGECLQRHYCNRARRGVSV
jgi:hypothetical protein